MWYELSLFSIRGKEKEREKKEKERTCSLETYEFIDCFNARVTAENRGRRKRKRSKNFHGNRGIILQ